jgi:hypothetical protein
MFEAGPATLVRVDVTASSGAGSHFRRVGGITVLSTEHKQRLAMSQECNMRQVCVLVHCTFERVDDRGSLARATLPQG